MAVDARLQDPRVLFLEKVAARAQPLLQGQLAPMLGSSLSLR